MSDKTDRIDKSVENYNKYVEEQEDMEKRVERFLSNHPVSELMLILYKVLD